VNVGDVVVAQAFIQHDLDARPLFPRYEIPLYGRSAVPCDELLTAILSEAVGASLTGADSHFHLENEALRPVMHRGLVASGDCFVGDAAQAQTILNDLAQVGHVALAVEMEGAAVAQVCLDYGVPFAAMRTVSDRADHMAHVDFSRFVAEVASVVACAVLGRFVRMLSEK
jgi:adenosylhomocysteine nucleosidase